jgi:hypothetical protein
MPRAATTVFQHVAHATGALWTLPLPAALYPGTPESKARRDSATYINQLQRLAPAVSSLHPILVDGPEEDSTLRQVTLASERLWYLAPFDDYLTWIEQRGAARWADLSWLLSAIVPCTEQRPVLLKDPSHLGLWAESSVLGDVTVIRLERNVDDAAESFQRLIEAVRAPLIAADPRQHYLQPGEWLRRRWDLEAAQSGPAITVPFQRMCAEPVKTTLEALSAATGLSMPSAQDVRASLPSLFLR